MDKSAQNEIVNNNIDLSKPMDKSYVTLTNNNNSHEFNE